MIRVKVDLEKESEMFQVRVKNAIDLIQKEINGTCGLFEEKEVPFGYAELVMEVVISLTRTIDDQSTHTLVLRCAIPRPVFMGVGGVDIMADCILSQYRFYNEPREMAKQLLEEMVNYKQEMIQTKGVLSIVSNSRDMYAEALVSIFRAAGLNWKPGDRIPTEIVVDRLTKVIPVDPGKKKRIPDNPRVSDF